MSHPTELINSILEKVEPDYPRSLHEYFIEKAIPGTRMHPDIWIRESTSRKICCAVEIGYTRPEKLTAYRDKLKIQDVRWYDKSGNIHTRYSEEIRRVDVDIIPQQEFSVYTASDVVECFSERCEGDWCECEDEEDNIRIRRGIQSLCCASKNKGMGVVKLTGTMEYLPPVQQQSQQGGALKYTGAIAQNYDAERRSKAKWTVEQAVIEGMLADLPPGSWVLDAPCGSGRFLKYCLDHQLVYRGLDISEDMIRQASAKTQGQTPVLKFATDDGKEIDVPQIAFDKGSVLSSGIPDKSVDAALNIRITRWLSPDECQQMFREMQRIARDRIILTARVCNHSHARPLALFEAVMSPEWELARSECGASGPAEAPVEDPAYRIFMFRRKQSVMSQPKRGDDAWIMDPYKVE